MKRIGLVALMLAWGIALGVAIAQDAKPAKPALPPKITEGKTDAGGFVPYWVALEPVQITADEAGGKGIDKEYFEGEAKTTPIPGDTVTAGGVKRLWKTVASSIGTPIVDCEDVDGATLNAVIYLVSYVKLDKDEPKATLAWASDDGGALYVNGKEVSRSPGPRHCDIDGVVAKDIPLKKGVNTLMLKVLNGYGTTFGVLRLVGSDDKVLAGATVLMAPEGRTAPKDAFWYEVDTKSKPLDEPFSAYLAKQKK